MCHFTDLMTRRGTPPGSGYNCSHTKGDHRKWHYGEGKYHVWCKGCKRDGKARPYCANLGANDVGELSVESPN